jgi:hypothetical protein
MNSPCCRFHDDPYTFDIANYKRRSQRLAWYYSLVDAKLLQLIQSEIERFWKHTDFIFEHSVTKRDAIISNKIGEHRFQKSSRYWSKKWMEEEGYFGKLSFCKLIKRSWRCILPQTKICTRKRATNALISDTHVQSPTAQDGACFI